MHDPILFPVSAYAVVLRRGDRALSDYPPEHFAVDEQPGLGPFFVDALERGCAIVLLDGLDEVLDASERVLWCGASRSSSGASRRLPAREKR